MKTFKRLFSLLLALMMALTLFGCNGEKSENSDSTKVNTTEKSEEIIIENTPEGIVKAYYKSIEKLDVDTYGTLLPDVFKRTYENYADGFEASVTKTMKDRRDYLETWIGKNVTIDVEVIEVNPMTEEALEMLKNRLALGTQLTTDIDEGAIISFNIYVEGDDGSDGGTGEISAIKEDGIWKVYSDTVSYETIS